MIVFSPSRSQVNAFPLDQSPSRLATASAGVVPAMNWWAIRMMLRRATLAAIALPPGTLSAAPIPTLNSLGASEPSKYSSTCRRTSALSVRAGKTSTKRNSSVLNPGFDIAQSSIVSLHQDILNTDERSPAPSSASRRAVAVTSLSSGSAIAATVPPGVAVRPLTQTRRTEHRIAVPSASRML